MIKVFSAGDDDVAQLENAAATEVDQERWEARLAPFNIAEVTTRLGLAFASLIFQSLAFCHNGVNWAAL